MIPPPPPSPTGTLSYFVNDAPQGVCFKGLRGVELFPAVCFYSIDRKVTLERVDASGLTVQPGSGAPAATPAASVEQRIEAAVAAAAAALESGSDAPTSSTIALAVARGATLAEFFPPTWVASRGVGTAASATSAPASGYRAGEIDAVFDAILTPAADRSRLEFSNGNRTGEFSSCVFCAHTVGTATLQAAPSIHC